MKIEIITSLAEKLKSKLIAADEIWIAVALINLDGLNFILRNIKSTCKQNYVLGIDLPTDPKALKLLNDLQLKTDLTVHIYTEINNFHPKLYLISNNENYVAFTGSANCTNGGLKNNVELTTIIHDNKLSMELLDWFNNIRFKCKPLTTEFVNDYEKIFQQRLDRKKQDDKFVEKEKNKINNDYAAKIKEKGEFLKVLSDYRASDDYNRIVGERAQNVKTLRENLDYPFFHNINIDCYFKEWELGHLIPISIPAIKRNIEKLKTLLKFLIDEKIDIATRYERALKGDLKVEGVSKAFISKVLTIHRPDLYFVKNSKTEIALKKFGIKLPRGLTEGEKYKVTTKFLKIICEETNIKDLTVLDYFLYLEGSK